MNRLGKRFWASRFYPRFSPFLEQANRAARFKDWLRANSLPRVASRSALYERAAATLPPGTSLDYLEFGVWQGQSLRTWSSMVSDPEARFFGFDTFTGLPEDWVQGYPRGTFDEHGRLPIFDDPRVSLATGLFQDTLPTFLTGFRARGPVVVHLDADLYSSTLYCLARMDPFMVPGSIAIFDEFGQPLHEFRAFEDYLQSFRREWRPLAGTVDAAGVPESVAFVVVR